ncbi:MAG TPA: KH domain-containing protein [Candidatus Saccharimonadales bacterium]
MSNIDQQFVEYVVKSLVSRPDDVKVERSIDEKGVLLVLSVHPEDLGRVIGRRGTTAQSLRTLLRALGTKNDARYNLKIVDTDNLEGTTSSDDAPAQDDDTSDDSTVSSVPVDNTSEDTVEDSGALTKKTRKELADLDDLDI